MENFKIFCKLKLTQIRLFVSRNNITIVIFILLFYALSNLELTKIQTSMLLTKHPNILVTSVEIPLQFYIILVAILNVVVSLSLFLRGKECQKTRPLLIVSVLLTIVLLCLSI